MDNRGVYSTPSTPSNRPGYTRDQAGDSSTSSATISAISALPISRTGTAQGQRDTRRHSTKAMQRRQSYSSYDDDDDDDDDEEEDESGERDRTIRGLEDLRNNGGVPANSDQSNEDVFLKLARSNSTTSRAADRLERRRARLSQHSQYRNSMPAETQSSPIASASIFNSSPPEVREDVWRRNARMSSPADYRTRRMSQASEHLEDRTSVTPRASFGARPQSMLRRENSPGHSRSYSMADSSPRTGLANRASTRGLSASPQIDDNSGPSLIDQDFALSVAGGGGGGRSADSASTVSTTAASSVWDELDDLKSRIRRLEVTGHIPASSRAGGASNSSGDRPRTATTTVTTVSSSPRHNAAGISPVNSTFSGTPNATTSHPLLHTALAKSKAVMPPDVYKYLELAAKDALDLANTVGAPGAAAPTNMSADRTVRRKADSVCRSLTELCLALSENRHNIAPAHHPFIQAQFAGSRPASRAFGMESVIGRDRESILAGRESVLGDRLPPRAIGRFAERKNSLASLSVTAGYSPRSDPIASPTTAGTIRHRNSMGLKEGFLEERERERFRASSRAITEVNATPRLPNSRLSHPTTREYTTQDTNSTLPPRRSSIAPTGTHSSPLGPSPNKRFFSDNPSRMSQEFTMTGGPVNDRLVNAANADPDMSTRFANGSLGRTGSRRIVRGLRESVDLDSGRLTALRRAEAATERLLRR
ncbi:hypothetical protein BDD12DRAFT_148113 [Trichophaea hybrida]|nr:hypothetical protein BDD12DRAFT_148113 [Trichophaea hybrida]